MPKVRVYEIAKQLNVNNKELIEKFSQIGISVKNHMATVEENEQKKIFEYINKSNNKKESGSLLEEKKDNTVTKETQKQNNTIENTKADTASNQDENKKPYNNNDQRKFNRNPNPNQNRNNENRPYNKETGDENRNNRPYNNENRTYNNNDNRNRPPYNKDGNQNRPPYNKDGNQNRPPYNRDGNQSRPPYNKDGNQSRPPYNKDGNQSRPPYNRDGNQSRPPYNRDGNQSRPPYNRDGNQNRPPYNKDGNVNKDGRVFNKDAKPDFRNKDFDNKKDNRGFTRNDQKKDNRPAAGSEQKKDSRNFKEKTIQAEIKNKKEQLKNTDKENKHFLTHEKLPKTSQKSENVKPAEEEIKVIEIAEKISVKAFADKINKPANQLIKHLMKMGIMAGLNQEIDFETASGVALEFGFLVEEEKPEEEIDILELTFGNDIDKDEDKKERPPIVVVMGHVDHGKTSLLDSIRKAKVASSEAGGITQHIGAYTVSIDGKPITFLDTPGHEAFTAMRMRGAQVTDIAVLVVAADDGVMPQTIEAINHAKAAGIDIIVAINKIDKPSANPDRVKQELVEYGLVTEDWGGETICVPVSAQTKEGIDNLLEMIIIVSEMKELRVNPNKNAKGTVIEALLDKGRGSVATVLVQEGTLKVGDSVVVGTAYGKVRAMMDDKGRNVKKAGPSIPVEILGLSEVPFAGDLLYVTNSDKQARQIAESIVKKGRIDMLKDTTQKISLDDLFTQIKQGNVKDLNLVVKADVQGSVEAVKASLERLSTEEVRIRAIHGGVGAITESDVMLASASNAIIIGFNVRPDNSAKKIAEEEKVDIRLYRVIYGAIEDIQAAIKGMLDPIYQEKITGHAEIRQIFKASNIGNIAGSYVTDGKIFRNSKVRILRDHIVVYEGTLDTLKRFKDDVKEVNAGYECGLLFTKYNDVKEGDVVEAYVMEEIPR